MRIYFLYLSFLVCCSFIKLQSSQEVLSNIIQLTFEGNRSGEGYFSASGKKICFQAENHPGNPYYQIYTLNLDDGVTQLVSTGIGKSTCAWFHPSETKILYASTHLDPKSHEKQKREFELRNSGTSRKYSWDYDPNYDLFLNDLKTNSNKRLTREYGYDAECAFSPNGEKIVFTSNRHLYTAKSNSTNNKINEHSLSRSNEIYSMDSDGGNVKRLTNHDGYDGGPFYDSTGKYICWRRFSSDGHQAEIYRMSEDGSNKKRLTNLRAMSWAPFFHPSNKYLIFTTNLQGFQNFELYIVDFEGQKKPVRITNREGFDGLPSFSPDGNLLAWTSNANSSKKSQIYLADWNHEKAIEALSQAPLSDFIKAEKGISSNKQSIDSNVSGHIKFLCSQKLNGRATGSMGMKLANAYVADFFEKNKLTPYQKNTWHQNFSYYKHATIDAESYFKDDSHSQIMQIGSEWNPLAFSDSDESMIDEITFVGYGLRLSKRKSDIDYDSYTHLDVKDKWIMCIRGLPSGWDKKKREKYFYESTLRKKASVARDLGAKGIIFIQDSNVTNTQIARFDGSTKEKISIQAISINNGLRDQIFQKNKKDFIKISKAFETGEIKMGFKLNCDLKYNISITRHTGTCQNTIGFFDNNNNGKLDEPFILIGAHLDHIGIGKQSSRAKKSDQGKIHPGADDNGSGISALLEIIRLLLNNPSYYMSSKYEIAFATWSGEEIGLVGSSHFSKVLFEKNNPHTSKSPILAYLNMDMIGRMRDKMTIHGVGSSSIWRKIIQQANIPVRLSLNLQNDSHIPTDTTSFYSRGVPILSAFTGLHEDYHSPTDTEDKINYEGIIKCSKLFSRIISILGNVENVDYISQETPIGAKRSRLRAFLGTIPNYSQTDTKGVLLSGVSKGGPADKASLKDGDLIIKLSDKEIENIYDYTEAISELTPDQTVNIEIIRNNKRLALEITPKSR